MKSKDVSPQDSKVVLALEEIFTFGGVDGDHHKQWLLDKVVRTLAGDGYDEWVKKYMDGEDGPETYEWDTGIAP